MRRSAGGLILLLTTGLVAACGLNIPGLTPPPAGASPAASGSATPTPSGFLHDMGQSLKEAADSTGEAVSSGAKDISKEVEERKANVQKAVDEISPQDERAEGQAASLQVIRQNGGLLLDERLVRYVNQVANVVGQHGQRIPGKRTGKPRTRARRFVVGILNDSSLNAFALPGGYLFVTRGLMERLTCEADLAWVLGHEEAHVDLEHGLAALKAEVGAAATLRELGIGDDTSFKSDSFFAKIAGKLAEIALKPHSEEEEEAADSHGLDAAIAAGYDPAGARRVLQILDASGSQGGGGHADPHTRFELLKARVEAVKGTGRMIGAARYDREGAQRLEATLAASAPAPDHPEEWTK